MISKHYNSRKAKTILPISSVYVPAWLTAIVFVAIPSLPLRLVAVEPPLEVGVPLGLPALPTAPADGATVALGKKLFFDRRLSFNDTMACGMCHIERQAFTSNQLATSVGMAGKSLRRNAPSLFNVAYETKLFRDGRENSLETQVWSPIVSPDEMAAPSVGWELAKVRSLPDYPALFERSFPGRGISMETIGFAIAAYERTLLLANSPFDRWRYGGEKGALSQQEQLGYALFTGKAGCSVCHLVGEQSALFTDGQFHDTGLSYSNTMGLHIKDFDVRLAEGNFTRRNQEDVQMISNPTPNDLGRFEVTQNPKDRWTFKTPSLRNVALTRPYMHDGSLKTLVDVVNYYDAGGFYSPNKSALVKPMELTDEEKQALVGFLNSLTGLSAAQAETKAGTSATGPAGEGH
jgi:cytochrome c peroxidase